MKKIYLSIFFAFATLSFVNAQTTVVLVADRDNTIFSENNTTSNGAGQHFFAGATAGGTIRRGLLHFNLSTIPVAATITSATLTITANKLAASSTGISLRRVTKDWGEGTSDANMNEGGGAPATTGDATWANSVYPATTWTAAGGDFVAATASVGTVAFGPVQISNAALISDIQNFVTNASSNFGFIIMGTNETGLSNAIRFSSRQHPTQTQRPQLSVTYTSNLPVTLKNFTAAINNNTAVLQWKTATEINNQHFNIEHSINGTNFSAIGQVKGSGNSIAERSYNFTHNNIAAGKNFYRLAQTDFNGLVKYSPIVVVTSSSKNNLQIKPNPATSFINVTSASTLVGATYLIHTTTGQIAKKGILMNQRVDVQKLPAGQYLITIESVDKEFQKAFFIKE